MDPRINPAEVGPRTKQANLSDLMQAKGKASKGEKVIVCPFGCKEKPEDADEHGYCRHLVGFTNDGKTFEPMITIRGRRVVQVKHEKVPVGVDGEGNTEYGWGPPQLEPVLKGDVLVRITVSSRVYRDVDKGKKQAGKDAA